MPGFRLELTRPQILAHRRRVGALDGRVLTGETSLRRAAWAGLQDSVPRAALLSIHARVSGAGPSTWEDPSLVQLWGPRFSVYVVSTVDVAVFSLARLSDDPARRHFAEDLGSRLDSLLDGRTMTYSEAGHALGEHPNQLRYAATTGRFLIRWDGARPPTIWSVAAPDIDPREARLELARRYLHVFGPSHAAAFGEWAGITASGARAAFEALKPELAPVSTPVGDGWILAADEPAIRAQAPESTAVRLLPSGDAYWLLHGRDRELLVPGARHREALWKPSVWPGALLIAGELAGTWRRAGAHVRIETWRTLSRTERDEVEREVESLPLPETSRPVASWAEPGVASSN